MQDHVILGIHIINRMKDAVQIQAIFSEFGCNIKTRLGLHDVDASVCSPAGIVLLEIFGGIEVAEKMKAKLAAIPGVEVQMMHFVH